MGLCFYQLHSPIITLVGVKLKLCKLLGTFYLFCAVPGEEDSSKLSANEEIVSHLVSMGFNYLHCQKAAISTSNVGVEEAMNWLLSHMDDPGI